MTAPVLTALLNAPLAPEEDRLTPEQLTGIDAAMADIFAGRVKTFTSGEVVADLLRRMRAETGERSPEDDRALRYFEQRVAAECTARGITEEELLAIVDEKHAFNERNKR